MLGARVGFNDHVTIGDGAQIAATSIVHGDFRIDNMIFDAARPTVLAAVPTNRRRRAE